ncbi:MAG: hypothetical protein HC907_30815 [Richelia sp. SM1_7_0]|nr:hypothetical protein [Richelia sp. SM1_7_0]
MVDTFSYWICYIGENGFSYGELLCSKNWVCIEPIKVESSLSLEKIKKLSNLGNSIYVNKRHGLSDLVSSNAELINFEDTPIVLKCLINDDVFDISNDLKQKLNKYDPEKEIDLEIAPLFVLAHNYEKILYLINYMRFMKGWI